MQLLKTQHSSREQFSFAPRDEIKGRRIGRLKAQSERFAKSSMAL